MTDYREIIRLHSLKFSNVSIANSLCCSRNTVSEVLKLAETHSLEWPIPETLSNKDIEYLFYPNRGNNEVSAKYCYAAHESRLHQNDRCKRFTLCLVLTVRFRSLAPWGKLFQLFI